MITFVYNPINTMVQAAQNMYPSLKANIQFNPMIQGNGQTAFPEGSDTPLIDINAELMFDAAIETMAHELAHAATKVMSKNDPAWAKASEKIMTEFSRLANEEIERYQATAN